MSAIYPSNDSLIPVPASAHTALGGYISLQVIRDPNDPLFFADITLLNIVVGSRYWIAQASNPDNVLATGEATSTEVVLENIPAYANPMFIEVHVRKGTSGTRYVPLKTYGYLVRGGISVYISQVEVPIE